MGAVRIVDEDGLTRGRRVIEELLTDILAHAVQDIIYARKVRVRHFLLSLWLLVEEIFFPRVGKNKSLNCCNERYVVTVKAMEPLKDRPKGSKENCKESMSSLTPIN